MDVSHLQAALDFTRLGLEREVFSVGPIAGFGPFALRWYSLAYIVGILLAWWYVTRLLRQPAAPMTALDADALVTWSTLGIIAGGRLAWLAFYADHAALAANPLDALRIWEGGMAFHGGALGVGVAILLYARARRLNWLRVLDYVACGVPIGLLLGRLANFVNGELWGRPTGASWGVIFPDADGLPRHPSQLYEAGLEGVVLFLLLAWLFWRTSARLRPGFLTGAFMAGYGVARFVVEFFREPDRGLGTLGFGLTMGQTLTLPMLVGGLYLIATASARRVRVEPIAGPVAQQ